MHCRFSSTAFFSVAWALLFTLVSLHAAPTSAWPVAESDLPAQPGLRQGTLQNGLRYLILPNSEPRDRISVRLVVGVGSLHETEDERGLAHFVEHMAFRGTRKYPAGSLTATLQRLGLGLGPDSAAFTFFDHTTYHLELPDAKPASLREGLKVFREYASEVTFDSALIERERGVILSEKATRDTPDARNGAANLAFLFPGSRQIERTPIGTTESIQTVKRERFVSFYDAWYRPERMALVVVGNVEPSAALQLIEEEFGSLVGRGEPRPEPTGIVPARASTPDIRIFSDPGLLGIGLSLEHPVARPHGADTHARRVRTVQQELAFTMLHLRLDRLARERGAKFVTPSAAFSRFLPGWHMASINAGAKIDDWAEVAASLEREHRRAVIHGFTASELQEARAIAIANYEQAARTAPTWPSDWLATRLVDSVVEGFVLIAPDTLQRDIAADLAATNLADCNRAFREVWTTAAPHVYISANPALKLQPQQVADALNQAREEPVTPPLETPPPVFAYTNFGPAGKLVRDEPVYDLDLRLTRFENGVRANFKATTLEAETVEIRVRIGEGKLTLPVNKPGLDVLANAAFTAGGLGRHTAAELSRLLAGRSLGYSFSVESDCSVLAARCARKDLLLCLQILTAHLTDAAYRPESLHDASAQFGSMYASLASSPGGPISLQAPRVLFHGDTRFGPPLANELGARTLQELSAWLEPQLKRGAIELSVVGDVTWEEAQEALSRTFGALPTRSERSDTRAPAALNFARTVPPQIYSIDPKLGRSAIACYWPVPEIKDARDERRCRLLSMVLSDRLRVRLRDELGAAYSPSASFLITEGFSKLNYFTLYAEVEPMRTQQALKIIQREAAALAASGPEADEFNRAHQPFIHEMSDYRRTNAYWGATVLFDAQYNPARLAAARDRTDDVASITQADLTKLAKRYLAPKNAFTFLTVPAIFSPAPAPR